LTPKSLDRAIEDGVFPCQFPAWCHVANVLACEDTSKADGRLVAGSGGSDSIPGLCMVGAVIKQAQFVLKTAA